MPIIIISSEEYEEGREMAGQVAQALGYRHLDRQLLDEIAASGGASRNDLEQALEDTPGFFTRRARQKKLLTALEVACLERLLDDNIVCHGLAAHLYVRGVSHVLRVRIISDPEKRVRDLSQMAGVSTDRARKMAQRHSQHEKSWSNDAYGLDQTDPSLYDLVISLGAVERDKAIEVICDMVGYRKFQPMTYSRKCIKDKVLAAQVRASLVETFADARVESNDGTVVVYIQSLKKDQRKKQEQVRHLAAGLPGVRHLEVHIIHDYFGQAAQSSR